jgi:hypothetical protein
METPRLNIDFTRFSDGDLLTEGETVIENMTGNTDFPTPTPDVPLVTKVVETYKTSLGKANGGTHADVLAKNAARTDVETTLAALAAYCNSQSTDPVALAGTGMTLAGTRSKIGALSKPKGFTVAPGPNKGTVKLTVDKVENAAFYEFQFTSAPATAASSWQMRTSSKKTIIIDGLVSGTEYVFRVAGAGSDASRVYSDEITSFVL